MAYFLPSFFQKRLLKYALSRLGIVDTEALDPDNLGIRWGQRSTVELRDVGLKLEKLANLLNLPPTCTLLSARVRFLRITIPADIYSSGIICEASGINVHIQLLSDEPTQDKHGGTKSQLPSGHCAEEGQILPTATNLAESFLEAEPTEEKEELQAAISSQSHISQKNTSFTDEEDEELGLGNETMSLPSFVAGFLKGVADRFQLKIMDVAVRLDMELKQDGPSKRHPEDKPDIVAGLFTVGEIDVHRASDFTAGADDPLPMREGKRLISLADINFGLVSDPAVFSNYARFTVPASPTTTMQSKESQSSSRAFSPPPALESSDSDIGLAMTRSTIFEPSLGLSYGSAIDPGLNESVISHDTISQDGRFSDADSDTEYRHGEYPDDSRMLADNDDPFHDNPGYLDSVIDTQFDDFDDEPSAEHSETLQIAKSGDGSCHLGLASPSNPGLAQSTDLELSGKASQTDSFHRSHDYSSQEERHGQFGSGSDVVSQFPEEHHAKEAVSTSLKSFPRYPLHESATLSEAGSVSTEGGAHLTESKYFSHDEAQSLYMSAMSQGTSESFIPNMPGAWDSIPPGERAGNLEANRKKGTVLSDDTNISNEEQDELSVSTPKLNVPSDSYFGEQPEEGRTESQSAVTHRASTPLSPVLHKPREIRKPIFNVDKILIWLPSSPSEAEPNVAVPKMPVERTESDPKDLLSSIRDPAVEESMFASKSARSLKGLTESRFSSGRNFADHHEGHIDSQGLAVEIFAVSVHFDIATGWLLVKAGQRLCQIFIADEKIPSRKSNVPEQPAQQVQQTALKLDVHKISIKFIEHLAGHSFPLENASTPPPSWFTSLEDIVLQLTASGLALELAANKKRTSLRLDISKFAFGIAADDLISFNESLKLRESIRDINMPSQGDISLQFTKSAESAKVDVTTLPLHIKLNIQQLEEVLGWMGGLSTILELGSSISSTSTMKGAQKPPKKRTRGVHFETPAPATHKDPQASVPWKVNARLGGVVVDVTGETHYLNLSTTAVKIVSRFEGIGVQIDKARLSGPHSLDDMSDAPAKVTLTNIRVEFLFSPKEVDLDRLLTLITPSKDKYDDDDEIMLDTLLRQRRQGSVLRITVAEMKTDISSTASMAPLASLGSELGRLSTVTKYLPEDDRPGILILTLVREFETQVHVGGDVGDINAHLTNVEVAWISMPSLLATQIGSLIVTRNHKEELVGEAMLSSKEKTRIAPRPPVLMARFIPDEMDPTFKIKLHHLRVEYTIPSVMAFLGLGQDATGGELAGEMASSIANLAEHSDRIAGASAFSPSRSEASGASSKPTKLAVLFQDCVLGLNPRNSPAKGLVVLTDSKFSGTLHGDESSEAALDIRKASIMIIDNEANAGNADNLHQRTSAVTQSDQVQEYIAQGYVPVSSISTATVVVKMMRLAEDGAKSLDVELKNRLLILETCADSTQTLISILNGLQPPTPPSVTVKYRTEVTPIQDMLASFSGNAFNADPSFTSGEKIDPALDLGGIPEEEEEFANDELEYVSDFYPKQQDPSTGDVKIESTSMGGNKELFDSFHSQYHVSSSLTELDFREDHFAKQSAVGGTAHRWDSTENTYGLSNDHKLQKSPLRVRVRDVHVIWNLFDGYDWQRTRDTISKAVEDVEIKATERRARSSRVSPSAEDEEESVIGDFLFNSIYIGIPANKDPRELHREINRDINDLTSETGSYATSTTVTGATARQGRSVPGREKKRLRLHRSKHHKMTFELSGICADLVVFPPDSEETQSSLDIRVKDLEIYDHVPTSTWKKFATYLHEAGERESGTSMVHLEILTVKPIPELAASEIVLKATVLPLRLHVDQDALDFMSRFFEFRDESMEASAAPGDVPFLQRVEVNAIQVKLDFKPKRVDYAGLRSGRTTEFMNFFILDGSDMVLRHVIIYGVSGFDRLGNTLNDIWMPDVKANQLPGVLAGLAPIRSLVNVGGGVRQLFVVPMREYKKDGRIVRSIQKGAAAFAKTTSNELVKLGAKLAIGTQTVLQGAEDLLTSPNTASAAAAEDRDDEEEAKKISPYADQPIGVVQGLRGAFSGLERDLLLARDAIVAVPGEVVESSSAKDAAKAVLRRAPTVILRPAIGVSKAVGQTLLGAGNTLDPSNRRKMEDKYKRH